MIFGHVFLLFFSVGPGDKSPADGYATPQVQLKVSKIGPCRQLARPRPDTSQLPGPGCRDSRFTATTILLKLTTFKLVTDGTDRAVTVQFNLTIVKTESPPCTQIPS
jgi:hypothetical protein